MRKVVGILGFMILLVFCISLSSASFYISLGDDYHSTGRNSNYWGKGQYSDSYRSSVVDVNVYKKTRRGKVVNVNVQTRPRKVSKTIYVSPRSSYSVSSYGSYGGSFNNPTNSYSNYGYSRPTRSFSYSRPSYGGYSSGYGSYGGYSGGYSSGGYSSYGSYGGFSNPTGYGYSGYW